MDKTYSLAVVFVKIQSPVALLHQLMSGAVEAGHPGWTTKKASSEEPAFV
jgi:hypothetical protein